jgi:hypothetical protein
MHAVTEDELRQIWRDYIRERVNQRGGVRRFAEEVGINHANVSRFLGGDGNVPESWIVKMSETIGPSLAEIYSVIALRCANASPKGAIQGYVDIPAARTKGTIKRELAGEFLEELAAPESSGQGAAESPTGEPRRKGRASRHPKGPRHS